VFERRLRAVRRDLSGVLAGDVEGVHRMRVASRRLREAMPLLATAAAPGKSGASSRRKITRALRRVTRALGGVRELDVALGYLDEIDSSRPDLAGATRTVGRFIRWEREVRRVAMLRRLEGANLKRIERRILARLVDFQVTDPGSQQSPRLGRRIERRAAGLEMAVEAAGDLYAPDRLHGVRIATKKLRYALELARELGAARTLGSVRRLKRMQDLLGRMHDLEVLAGYTRLLDLQASTRGRLHARIGLLLDAIARETRLLHAAYLASRPDLADVAARCRDEFCPQLAAHSLVDIVRPPRRTGRREHYGNTDHVVRRPARSRRRTERRVSR
jgi:CHAD domain-containing protein